MEAASLGARRGWLGARSKCRSQTRALPGWHSQGYDGVGRGEGRGFWPCGRTVRLAGAVCGGLAGAGASLLRGEAGGGVCDPSVELERDELALCSPSRLAGEEYPGGFSASGLGATHKWNEGLG